VKKGIGKHRHESKRDYGIGVVFVNMIEMQKGSKLVEPFIFDVPSVMRNLDKLFCGEVFFRDSGNP
jgi:hypothetical protein